jgi:hypothetical protein
MLPVFPRREDDDPVLAAVLAEALHLFAQTGNVRTAVAEEDRLPRGRWQPAARAPVPDEEFVDWDPGTWVGSEDGSDSDASEPEVRRDAGLAPSGRMYPPPTVVSCAAQDDRDAQTIADEQDKDKYDENFGPVPKALLEAPKRIDAYDVPLDDLEEEDDDDELSEAMRDFLETAYADGHCFRRDYQPGGPSNPDGLSDYVIYVDVNGDLRSHPTAVRVITYFEKKLGVKIAGAFCLVHSGDTSIEGSRTKTQLFHYDYSATTARIVFPIAFRGSTRTFAIKDEHGAIVWVHAVDGKRHVAVVMSGKWRGRLYGRTHSGGWKIMGPGLSMVLTTIKVRRPPGCGVRRPSQRAWPAWQSCVWVGLPRARSGRSACRGRTSTRRWSGGC